MRKSVFKKFLDSLEGDEALQELAKLYDQIPQVKDHYVMELGSAEERKKIYDQVKKKIEKYYATKSYRKPKAPRIRLIQNTLKEQSKIAIFDHEMADLYLHDVACAVRFVKEYYYHSNALENNINKSLSAACALITEGNYQNLFDEKYNDIMDLTRNNPPLFWILNKNYLETFKSQ